MGDGSALEETGMEKRATGPTMQSASLHVWVMSSTGGGFHGKEALQGLQRKQIYSVLQSRWWCHKLTPAVVPPIPIYWRSAMCNHWVMLPTAVGRKCDVVQHSCREIAHGFADLFLTTPRFFTQKTLWTFPALIETKHSKCLYFFVWCLMQPKTLGCLKNIPWVTVGFYHCVNIGSKVGIPSCFSHPFDY